MSAAPRTSPAALAAAAVGVRALAPVRPVAEAARALVAAGPAAAGAALSHAEPDLAAAILEVASAEEAAARFRKADDEVRRNAFVRLCSEVRLGELAPRPTPAEAGARKGRDASRPFPALPWATVDQVRSWRQVADLGRPAVAAYLREVVEAKGEISRRGLLKYASPPKGPKPPKGAPPAAVSALHARPLDVDAIEAVAYQRLAVLREPVTPATLVGPEQLALLHFRRLWSLLDEHAQAIRSSRAEPLRALRDRLNPLLSDLEALARSRCGPDASTAPPKRRAAKTTNATGEPS